MKDFFKINLEENEIEWLIRLAYPGLKPDETGNTLFNYFDEKHREGQLKALDIFKQIRRTKLLLNDLLCAPEIANLLDYVLHAEGGRNLTVIFKELQEQSTKAGILMILKRFALACIPVNNDDGKLQEVNYEDHWKLIYNLFLLLGYS